VDGNLEVTATDADGIWDTGFAGMAYYKESGVDDFGVFDNFLFETIDASDVQDWELYN
jgi:hypothetical protein